MCVISLRNGCEGFVASWALPIVQHGVIGYYPHEDIPMLLSAEYWCLAEGAPFPVSPRKTGAVYACFFGDYEERAASSMQHSRWWAPRTQATRRATPHPLLPAAALTAGSWGGEKQRQRPSHRLPATLGPAHISPNGYAGTRAPPFHPPPSSLSDPPGSQSAGLFLFSPRPPRHGSSPGCSFLSSEAAHRLASVLTPPLRPRAVLQLLHSGPRDHVG